VSWLSEGLTTDVCSIADEPADPIATGTSKLMLLLSNNF
jgi:hypothetical protein